MITVEVITSVPPCSGGRLLLKRVEQLKQEYGEQIEIVKYEGVNEKTEEYEIVNGPAIIIDKDIRITGMCPSIETLHNALREAGL